MPRKRKCHFNDAWETEFPFIKRSLNESEVKCNKCSAIFTISNSGRAAITQHLLSAKHKKADVAASSSKQLTSFLRSKTFDVKEKRNALIEGSWAYHAIQHNHSFRSNDCTSKLIKQCFDEKYSCARTKCEAIVCNIFAPMSVDQIKSDLCSVNCVTIYSDCSNHGNIKLCPILARYFIPTQGVQIKILEISELSGETSNIISNYIQETADKYGIKDKLLAICADNTNCNFGGAARRGRNNVFYKIQESLGKNLIGVNCAAHILNNCIQTAAECLPVDIEIVVVKIYSFFYIYTVRLEQFKDICDSVDVEYHKLLGHSKTRWLTLKPSLERILKLFKALKLYFLDQEKCPTILKTFFNNPCAEAWLFFAHSQASTFHSYITQIESQHISMPEVSLIIKDLQFKLEERRKEIFLPLMIKNMVSELENSGDINIETFKASVTTFYETCLQYINQWNKAFKEVEVLEWVLLRSVLSWSEVEKSLAFLVQKRSDLNINDTELFDEISCIKNYASTEKIAEWKKSNTPVDKRWVEIITHFNEKCIKYANVLKIIEFCLSLPASNAPTERVFSIMNNIWTTEKTQLKVDTLKAILITKCNYSMNCLQFREYLESNNEILRRIHSTEKYHQ